MSGGLFPQYLQIKPSLLKTSNLIFCDIAIKYLYKKMLPGRYESIFEAGELPGHEKSDEKYYSVGCMSLKSLLSFFKLPICNKYTLQSIICQAFLLLCKPILREMFFTMSHHVASYVVSLTD